MMLCMNSNGSLYSALGSQVSLSWIVNFSDVIAFRLPKHVIKVAGAFSRSITARAGAALIMLLISNQ